MDFNIFGCSVTDKVINQKTLYYAASSNLCFCATWQNEETRKFHFSLKSNAVLGYCENSTSRCLISSIFLTHESRLILRCCMTL